MSSELDLGKHLAFMKVFSSGICSGLSEREIAVVNRPEFSQMRFLKKPQDTPLGRSVFEVLRAEFVRNHW